MPDEICIPNDHMCIAMHHPQSNAWWLCPSSSKKEDLNAWLDMIAQRGGFLADAVHSFCYTEYGASFDKRVAKSRALKKEGFSVLVGGLHQLSYSGTIWLRDNPHFWWLMHSASLAQLETFKQTEGSSAVILETLAMNKWFGEAQRRLLRGPSVVEKRWDAVFPEEMTFARQCQLIGLTHKEVTSLWPAYKNQAPALDLPSSCAETLAPEVPETCTPGQTLAL